MIDVLALRPCGVCRAYVSADRGCRHWRPPTTALTTAERSRRYKERKRAERTRDLARQAVEDFRRMMSPGVTG